MVHGINIRLDIAKEKISELENMYDNSSTKSGREEIETYWCKVLHYTWNGISLEDRLLLSTTLP